MSIIRDGLTRNRAQGGVLKGCFMKESINKLYAINIIGAIAVFLLVLVGTPASQPQQSALPTIRQSETIECLVLSNIGCRIN